MQKKKYYFLATVIHVHEIWAGIEKKMNKKECKSYIKKRKCTFSFSSHYLHVWAHKSRESMNTNDAPKFQE